MTGKKLVLLAFLSEPINERGNWWENKSLAISNLLRVGVKNLCCPSKEKVHKSLDKTILLVYNTPVINKISVPKTASVTRLNFLPRLKIS